MVVKTSIRFFNKKQVRSVWNDEESRWYYAATDIIAAITATQNARRYWNTLKSRNIKLSTKCRQLKLTAQDGKKYNTDVIDDNTINDVLLTVPNKYRIEFMSFIKGLNDPIDEQSKRKAYELYESNMLDNIEVGTTKGLQQIHSFIFAGLYEFAGKIRTVNISKGDFTFANCMHLSEILNNIERMKDESLEDIINKYVELNIAHPFREGNGRSTRIWLDMLLKKKLGKCVDWSMIDKKSYLTAMEKSSTDSSDIFNLISSSLTNKINDRELFMKGIDYSYYYEEIE